MEVRTTETVIPAASDAGTVVLPAPGAASAVAPGSRRRPVARTFVLTRDQEFAFIRSDLRRMIITAASLLAVMIVILLVVEG